MRFDLISIFPEYFAPLSLSLIGRAQDHSKLSIHVHNLRDYATGKHLSVDDTPSGGGAGMVMRPDVWGIAIDTAILEGASSSVVLAIPTPSGKPLSQRALEDLCSAQQIIVACGRYEGIDARVSEHYSTGVPQVEVFEFSLGDYVLNGGEIAAMALVEGVSRLLDGVVGNPESLVEESHSEAGLLEYPAFTRPKEWRGSSVPEVLFSGNHQKIARWRRSRSIERTARVRPDMIEALLEREDALDAEDREALARAGMLVFPKREKVTFRVIGDDDFDLEQVSELARRTFPMACPVGTLQEEIDDFLLHNLDPDSFRSALESGAMICVGEVEEQIVAYTLSFPAVPEEARGEKDLPAGAAYLSKCYTEAQWQGSGLSGALLQFTIDNIIEKWQSKAVFLGTGRHNKRAARFYRRHGFKKHGGRTFDVGGRRHLDYVFVLDITERQPS